MEFSNSKIVNVFSGPDFNVAVGLSKSTCQIYSFSNERLAESETINLGKETTSGVRFSSFNDNLIYTGTSSKLCCWDLRTKEKLTSEFIGNVVYLLWSDATIMCYSFLDTSRKNEGKLKVINSFDASANERILAAGTDLHSGDAYILFWDVRAKNILGGYWESHTNDVTQVNNACPDILI